MVRLEKIQSIVSNGADRFIKKYSTPVNRFAIMLAIKYLYIILTVVILKDVWYDGSGGYGIDFSFWKEILASLIFFLITVLFVYKKTGNRFVDMVLSLLFVLYYIPLNSAYAINNQPFIFLCLSNIYFALIIILTRLAVKLAKRFELKHTKPEKIKEKKLYTNQVIMALCAVICILFIIFKLFYNGISLSVSIDGGSVYETRADMVTYFEEISGSLVAYLLTILRNIASIAAPYYILVSLMQKKWFQSLLGVLCILAQFSVSSGKGTLLFLAVIAGLYICYLLKILKHFDAFVELGVLAAIIICLLEHLVFKSDKIFFLFIRRMMYVPAWLSTMYCEFFLEHSPVLWTQNVFLLQNILEPVYSISPLTIISKLYFNGEMPSPNTGLFAEAIMHAGKAGVVIYPVLLAVIFVFSAKVLKQYGASVQIFMSIKLALQLQNVPITRTDSVLSYVLFLFILWIIPKLPGERQVVKIQTKVRSYLKGRLENIFMNIGFKQNNTTREQREKSYE